MRPFAAQVFGLGPHAAVAFSVGREIPRVTCLSGTLWITCGGDPQDYVLTAGEHFVPRSRGRLVVEAVAMSPARFLLQRSEKPPSQSGLLGKRDVL